MNTIRTEGTMLILMKPNAKAVLEVIALFEGLPLPLRVVAENTELSSRTIRRQIKGLTKTGYIEASRVTTGETYRFVLNAQAKTLLGEDNAEVSKLSAVS
jgi:DNA-binding transcriptional ArsR family regulator